jgi:putative aldouronate transport system permease protein
MRISKFDWFGFINVAILTVFLISIIYPFIYLVNLSFSTAEGINSTDISFYLKPLGFSLGAYKKFLSNEFVITGYKITLFRTIVGTSASLFIMALGAYAISKKYLPHVKLFTTIIVITMFFSGGIIPTFLLMKNLGLIDNPLVLVLAPLVNAFFLLVMRNFFMNIPESIEESAKIDGAGDVLIFFKILLPLSMPVLATVGLWQAVQHWNAWFDSLMYITSSDKHVINIHIRRLVIEQSAALMDNVMGPGNTKDLPTPESMRAAAIMVTTLPILIVYPFIQRFFKKGAMVGSEKG